METNGVECPNEREGRVRKDFPVGRELKLCHTPSLVSESIGPKGLSRLKGIETLAALRSEHGHNRPKGLSRLKGIETFTVFVFTTAFVIVRKDFPVRRELKHDA